MNNIETMKFVLEALLEDRAWLESDAPKEAWDKNNQAITALRQAIEQAQQVEQPKVRTGNCLRVGVCASEGHKIAPPRQPLTDEELKKTWYDMKNIMGWYSFQEIARAIEQAHNIKENT